MIRLIITVIFFHALQVNAQTFDSMQIDPLGEKLAELAWENSSIEALYISNYKVAKNDLKSSKFSLIEGLGVRLNANEFTIDPVPGRNNFYPRYNFGFGLDLGQFIGMIGESKKAKNQFVQLDYAKKKDSLNLRSKVLQAYQSLKMMNELMQMARENLININSELSVVEQDYSEGQKDITAYNEVLELFMEAKTRELKAVNDFMISKIQLEEILGMNLENALRIINGE